MIYLITGIALLIIGLVTYIIYKFKIEGQFGFKSWFLNNICHYGILIFGFPGVALIILGLLRVFSVL